MTAGRPTIYTEELADKIFSLMGEGKSLRTICASEDMPNTETIFRWLRKDAQFSEQYARACENRTESQLELLNELGDTAIELSQDTGEKRAGAVVQAVRLKADNLKWVMSKMKPKKYGDKLDMTSDGKAITVELISYAKSKPADNTAPAEPGA
jgi:hypothetical protein